MLPILRQQENIVSSKLYVGNLSFKAREEDLNELFGQYGTVTSAKVITDRETGRSRGFGFVEYETPEEAQKAIEELDGKESLGRNLRVNIAQDKPRR